MSNRAREWWRDWVNRSDTSRLEERSISPLSLIAPALGVVGFLSSGWISGLLPERISDDAVPIFRLVFTGLVLVICHGVVVWKVPIVGPDPGTTVIGDHRKRYNYRYSEHDRLIARIVAVLMLILFLVYLIVYVVLPRENCVLSASLTVNADSALGLVPEYIEVGLDAQKRRFPLRVGAKSVIELEVDMLDRWTAMVVWADGRRSSFAGLRGCPKHKSVDSKDGLARLTVEID
jgi:hypothetical protein